MSSLHSSLSECYATVIQWSILDIHLHKWIEIFFCKGLKTYCFWKYTAVVGSCVLWVWMSVWMVLVSVFGVFRFFPDCLIVNLFTVWIKLLIALYIYVRTVCSFLFCFPFSCLKMKINTFKKVLTNTYLFAENRVDIGTLINVNQLIK